MSIRVKLFRYVATVAACAILTANVPASSQVLPEIWGSIGTQDEDISYAAGVKWFGFGIEAGTGKEGATGGDFLTFIPVPIVDPYVGVGVYSGDDTFAYSAGLHFTTGKLLIGGGYHSIRGINGKLGFKF